MKKKLKNKKGNIWKDSGRYLVEVRYFILVVFLLFILSALVGFFFSEQFVFFDDLLKGVYDQIEGLDGPGLTWFIFQNNILSAFFGLVAGVLLGVVPIFNSLTNGVLLGYVYERSVDVIGYSSIFLLVPHGIFELPAIFISLGMGLHLGMFVFSRKGKKISEFKRRFWSSMKVFLSIVLPLLVIAAIIEGLLISIGR